MSIGDLFSKGGVTIWPLLLLSILTVTVIFERSRFWFNVLNKEKEIVNRILDATRRDWDMATEIARQAYDQPVGRFLLQALQLQSPDPDLLRLALESSADDEIAGMRRGDKILEAVIAMAPLLGLLGTVLGLIRTLGAITFTALGTEAGKDAAGGIGESLISTAAGIIVALFALSFYRIFQGLVFNQAKVFRRAGNEVELLYRQKWQYEKNDDRANDRNVPSLDRYESSSDDQKLTF
jgi:biopolymer transport protein ExbB